MLKRAIIGAALALTLAVSPHAASAQVACPPGTSGEPIPIPCLPSGTAPSGSEVVPAYQDGREVKLTAGQIATLFQGSGSIAASSTTDLGSVGVQGITVAGAATIASFGSTAPAGTIKFLSFTGTPTLANSSGLILPGGADITVNASDFAITESLGSGDWIVLAYYRASGQALVFPTGAQIIAQLGYAPLDPANNLSDVGSAPAARANLGVAIGTNVEAWNANLDDLAGLTATANRFPYFSSSSAMALGAFGSEFTLSGSTLHIGTGGVASGMLAGGAALANVGAGSVTNAYLAQAGANTVKGNPAGSTGSEQDISLPSCSGSSNALIWTAGAGFGCNTLGAGGITEVDHGTVSGASSFTIGATDLTSAYKRYILYIYNGNLTGSGLGSGQLTLTVSTNNGSSYLASNYYGEGAADIGGSYQSFAPGSAGTALFHGSFLPAAQSNDWIMLLDIFNPAGGIAPTVFRWDSNFSNGTYYVRTRGTAENSTTTAIDNIKLTPQANISFSWELWGYP